MNLPRTITPTQKKVCFLLWEGRRVPVIARGLGMEVSTVRAHIRAIAAKLPNPHGLPAVKLIERYNPLRILRSEDEE